MLLVNFPETFIKKIRKTPVTFSLKRSEGKRFDKIGGKFNILFLDFSI